MSITPRSNALNCLICIKAFARIGRAGSRRSLDSVMVFCQGRNYSLKVFESGPVGPVIPFCRDNLVASFGEYSLEKIIRKEM